MSVRDRFDRDTLNALQRNQLILVKTKNSWNTRGDGNDF